MIQSVPSTEPQLPPHHLLACPKCAASTELGLNIAAQRCDACGTQFFDLAGLPCWFQNGEQQKVVWQNLFALTLAQSQTNLQVTEMELQQCDLLPQVRQRLQSTHQANQQIIGAFTELMQGAGLVPQPVPELAHMDPGPMLQYFELLLRDWAWDSELAEEMSPNRAEFLRVRQALADSAGLDGLGNLLVLGAGAGRLSYDLHTQLTPASTLALDNNPLLIAAAHRLVKQQKPWQLPEIQTNPQDGFPGIRSWTLQTPLPAADLSQWSAMAADAWHPPLRTGSFDLILTPWFIDVNGREVRDLMAQISRLLKPGGYWINTGPLLYSKHQPLSQQYTHDEIRMLLNLAGFTLAADRVTTSPYLQTPLAAQCRHEQMWTFAARAPMQAWRSSETVEGLPAWVILPHLPIPPLSNARTQQHPVLAHVLSLVDGKRSIYDLAAMMAPNLAPDQDPVAMMKAVFTQYLLAD